MKRFLYALIVLLWTLPAAAQVPMTGAGVGAPGGAAPYVGPGDVATFNWWCGFRAYNAATAGTKAIRVIRASDSTQQDINTLANGHLDVATLTTFLTATTGKVVTCYDKVSTADATQATSGKQPAVTLSALNSFPCATFLNANSTILSTATTFTPTRPFTFVAVSKQTTNNLNANQIISMFGVSGNNNGGLFYTGNTASQLELYSGSSLTLGSVTDNAFWAIQATINTSTSSTLAANALSTSGSTGGLGLGAQQIDIGGTISSSNQYMTGVACEWGYANSNITSVIANMRSFWGL